MRGLPPMRVVVGVLGAVAVLGAAAALRLVRLGTPDRQYFDEVYYAEDAREYIERGVETIRAVHPPLAKWMMAGAIEVAGFDPFGWRLASALAGIAAVALVMGAAWSLRRSIVAALVAGVLVAVDGLSLAMSRIAMVDVFLAPLALGAFLATAAEVERVLGADGDERRPPAAGWWRRHRWWLLAGVCCGASVAVKWSGAALLPPVVGCIGAAHAVAAHRRGLGVRAALDASMLLSALLAFAVVPAAVYVASYAGWFANYEHTTAGRARCGETPCDVGPDRVLGDWWHEQVDIVERHGRLVPTHPYRSEATSWPLARRPVLMYLEACPERPGTRPAQERPCSVRPGNQARIYGLPNPVVWAAALMSVPVVVWRALRRRRRTSALVLTFLVALYVPWLASPIPGYLFYMTPIVPFMALAVVEATFGWSRWRPGAAVAAVVAVAAAGALAWYYPVLTGVELPVSAVEARLTFDSWR
ncbi:MAG: phospholipid carrier-dependent glycosyltransferase [Actinomycetota bacterium]|nr:phospholipid carrier-dependent glycosyltransferase [Actinomycetota bacterium]